MPRLMGLLLLALCWDATSAAAQDLGLASSLFSKVHSVTIFAQGVDLPVGAPISGRSTCGGMDLCGAGSEVLIDVASSPQGTHLEIGFGASYLGGLKSTVPGLDLRGSVRSLPTLSAYLTGISTPISKYVEPYAGFSFGIADLWNARAYQANDSTTPVKAQTFEYGATAGGYVEAGPLNGLFVEASYRVRRFDGVDWGTPYSPAGRPRSIDLSGWSVSVGWQFDLKERPHHAPDFTGLWELSRVDGQTLPFVVIAARPNTDSVNLQRMEIIHGLLHITSDTYRLAVTQRVSVTDPKGALISSGLPADSTQSGRFSEEDGTGRLIQRGRDPVSIRRIGDEIAFTLSGPRSVTLFFKKVE